MGIQASRNVVDRGPTSLLASCGLRLPTALFELRRTGRLQSALRANEVKCGSPDVIGRSAKARDRGEPTAQDWADACDTISYEIVTRIGVRVPRVYEGA